MLKADSSTLKSERDVQSRNAPPMMPSVVAFSVSAPTTRTMSLTELDGSSRLSSSTR